jgi:hypothetical protein
MRDIQSLAVVMAAVCSASAGEALASERTARLVRSERPVAQQYIVVLREDGASAARARVPDVARELAGPDGTVLFTYQESLRGFAARLPEARLQAILRDPRVDYVEEDGYVKSEPVFSIAAALPWGLDRIDERSLPMDGYYRPQHSGTGVNVYVIDSGIQMTHPEFGGRAIKAVDIVTSGGTANDCNGNGTALASIVGGSTYGVAKGATLRAVRVLDCAGSGTFSGLIAGIDWVRTNHVKPAVALFGLSTTSSTVGNAVASAISAGVSFAVAAGDNNANACSYSPGNVAAALTVGATTASDTRTASSNYGSCVDLSAPGATIPAAGLNGTSTTRNGTPAAAAHVAGAAALFLQTNTAATPATVAGGILIGPTGVLFVPPLPISITSPTGGSTVSGTVSVNALTSEALTVSRVDFFAGTSLINSDTSLPFSVSWNTTCLPAGSYSLTARAFNGGVLQGTSAAVSVTVPSSGSSQLLSNPGFESGDVDWTASGPNVINSSFVGVGAFSGAFKAALGGTNASTTFIQQDFSVPASACGATLSFWLNVSTLESTTAAEDLLRVQLRNTSGAVLSTLATYSNLDSTGGYTQKSLPLDLSPYRGMTLRLFIESSEDSSNETSFFVDDTALTLP